MKLTKSAIDKFSYEGNGTTRDLRWDSEVRGLGVRIYPTDNKKSFVLSYRFNGQKRLMVLGRYGSDLTLDQARDEARKYLFQARTEDPLLEAKKERHGKTVGDLCERYMREHARPRKGKQTADEDQRKIDSYLLPEWKNRTIKSITSDDVGSLHGKIGVKSIYEANRTLSLLSHMFRLAQHPWGLLDAGAANPARGHRRFPEVKRDRWVTEQELPKLVGAIAKEESAFVKAALWLYLLTGVRKSELLAAKWEDVDFDRQELCLPKTKADRRHYVPLSKPALKILRNLPRFEENPYILPGQRRGQHLVNISKPWLRIRLAAGVKDVRIHDLRRTVGSWMAQSGSSLHLIGKVLNHSNTSTTAIYARFGQDHVRDALEAHGMKLLRVAKTKRLSIGASAEGRNG